MADSRNIITTASVAVALLAVGWGLYVTQRSAHTDGGTEQIQGIPDSRSARDSGAGRQGGAGPGSAIASERVGGNSGATAVITAAVRAERLSSPLTALGTARANEAVEITSKASNMVTTVRFRDGERVNKGQVLVE